MIDWTCLLFAGTITATALRWLMDFNFAEPGDNPVMELPTANRRDITALANVINILVNLGVRVPEAWAHAQFDIPQPQATDVADGQSERILTPSRNGSADQLRTDTHGNPLTASQARRTLDALRLRATAEGRDLRVFDQLAGPVEKLIAGNEPEQARTEWQRVSSQINPEELRGVEREMFLLGELVTRLGAEERPEVKR
jgi:phage gp29-like protein